MTGFFGVFRGIESKERSNCNFQHPPQFAFVFAMLHSRVMNILPSSLVGKGDITE
jgi:hypothetical protein